MTTILERPVGSDVELDSTYSTLDGIVAEINADCPHDRMIEIYPVDRYLLKDIGLEQLPEGIAIIGGAARAIALRILTGKEATIRDIDLVYMSQFGAPLSRGTHHELSRQYMPDDYAYGHGVGIEPDVEQYFRTRDLTINELLVVDGKLAMTVAAREALVAKRVELTGYELMCFGGVPGDKMGMKALLMQAVFEEEFGRSELAMTVSGGGLFHIALALNKAMQYGDGVVSRFMAALEERGLCESYDIHDPLRFADYLVEETDFELRGSPVSQKVGDTMQDERSDVRLWRLVGRFAGKLAAIDDEFDGWPSNN